MENAHVNLYTAIHKYLRQQLFSTLNAVGTVNEFDPVASASVLRAVRELLNFCQTHLQHEDTFIHAAIQRRSPATHLASAADHREHQHRIAQLSDRLNRLERASPASAPALWLDLYRDLALFIGDNLDHMQVEETLIFQLLCDLFSPDELAALHAELVAAIPAAQMESLLGPMLAAQSYSDQLSLLADSRRQMPVAAFRGLIHSLASLLPTDRFLDLQQALGGDTAIAM